MSNREMLLNNERSALKKNQAIFNVKSNATLKKHSSKGALITIGVVLILLGVFQSSFEHQFVGLDRIIEETNTQCADGIQSKLILLGVALDENSLPNDTVEYLKQKQVEVITINDDKTGAKKSALKFKGKIIDGEHLLSATNADADLYEAINLATYSCAAYYYDDSAIEVRRQYGSALTTGKISNDKTINSDNISVNSVSKVQKTRTVDDKEEIYYVYEGLGSSATSGNNNFIESVASKTKGATSNEATLNAANSLNITDTILKNHLAETIFLDYATEVSKVKAGEGNNSNIHNIMNQLYKTTTSNFIDVDTSNVIEVRGSMAESPSLYAILASKPIDTEKTKNYSSDRILKLTENQLGVNNSSAKTIQGAITSTKTNAYASIGRFLDKDGNATPNSNILNTASPIINNSLAENSYSEIAGVYGGELLVEGAVNIGKALARASGATISSSEGAKEYARLNSSIIALNAEVDRKNRSPFDITSKNTFLGSIFYNFATTVRSGGLLTQFGNIGRLFGSAISSIIPGVKADDETERYLANFGDCETLGSIGAVGSATCGEIVVFDTSTLDDPFHDQGFINFIEENTIIDNNGTRLIKPDSKLADFINYNTKRITPSGITDGGILSALKNKNSYIPFFSDIISMIEEVDGTTDSQKRIATGEAFLYSDSNPDWEYYKYAQRYVSLARASSLLKKFSSEENAYVDLKYFEGKENPVIAFLKSQDSIANN